MINKGDNVDKYYGHTPSHYGHQDHVVKSLDDVVLVDAVVFVDDIVLFIANKYGESDIHEEDRDGHKIWERDDRDTVREKVVLFVTSF